MLSSRCDNIKAILAKRKDAKLAKELAELEIELKAKEKEVNLVIHLYKEVNCYQRYNKIVVQFYYRIFLLSFNQYILEHRIVNPLITRPRH